MNRTLSGATNLGQSGPGKDSNEGLLCIPQSSSITGASSSDYLMSYQDTRWEVEFYSSAEKQSVFSTAPANWAIFCRETGEMIFIWEIKVNEK